jgi:hypothetical protein
MSHHVLLDPCAAPHLMESTKLSQWRRVGLVLACFTLLSTVIANAQAQQPRTIDRTFFGMHLNQFIHEPALNVRFGTFRLWDSNTTWNLLNPAPGAYDWTTLDIYLNWAQTNNYDVIYTFGWAPCWESPCTSGDPGAKQVASVVDWNNFVTALVTHAKGKIKYYEIWNEPSITVFWTGPPPESSVPNSLAGLAQQAFQIIKSVDSHAQVLTPSPQGDSAFVASWMDKYLSAVQHLSNGTSVYADAIAFHDYVGAPAENVIALVNNMRRTATAHGLSGLPLFDTEGSWGNGMGFSDQDEQAAFLARSYTLQASMGIDRFAWYGWDYVPFGTLWDPAGVHKSGTAYGTISQWLIGAQISACSQPTADTWSCPLVRPNGYQAQILWSPTTSSLPFVVSGQFVQSRDLLTNCPQSIQNGQVILGHKPILLETLYPSSSGSTGCWWSAVQSLSF